MRSVMTAGSFDVPHIGHASFLQRASKLGDKLIVCLGTDEYIKRYKGNSTVFPYEVRRDLLMSLPYVDEVYPNPQDDLKPMLLFFKPDILVIGSDWGDRYFKQIHATQDWLVHNGITMVYLPYTPDISTTQIKERILQWQRSD